MLVVDLTQPIHPAIPVYPGDPQPAVEQTGHIDSDGFATELLHIGTHTGTNIAAPAHFVAGGAEIQQLTLDRCVAPGVLLDVRGSASNSVIGKQQLLEAEAKIGRPVAHGEAVILYTGAAEQWGDSGYLTSHPGLDIDGARLLVERSAAIVGIDAISVDLPGDRGFSAHRVLLQAGILVVENLKSLGTLSKHGDFIFFAAPLPVVGATGSPTRALAIIGG